MQQKNRRFLRGERHHWWPAGLSKHWTNERGLVNRITPNGVSQEVPPKKLARISDGHNITFDEPSLWDHTFEDDYDRADSDFPAVIEWLGDLRQRHLNHGASNSELHLPHNCKNDLSERLCECLVSLAVRSPRFRYSAVGVAEALRGPLQKKEQRRLAALNIQHTLNRITESLRGRGKFVIFFSESSEFIYGDGFYHNLSRSGGTGISDVRMLVPLTPGLAVLYVLPKAYMTEPKLMTRLANPGLVMLVNETVQIYSKECLFYRAEKPTLVEHFTAKEHLRYADHDPIDQLVDSIPGVRRVRERMFGF